MSPTPEQRARQDIDAALVAAGWIVQDRAAMNLAAGLGVAVREFKMASGHGFADYLLFVNGKAVGVLEAKPAGYALTNVELQADKYATGLPAGLNPPVHPLPFLYLSTGVETRFINGLDPEPKTRAGLDQRPAHHDAAPRTRVSPPEPGSIRIRPTNRHPPSSTASAPSVTRPAVTHPRSDVPGRRGEGPGRRSVTYRTRAPRGVLQAVPGRLGRGRQPAGTQQVATGYTRPEKVIVPSNPGVVHSHPGILSGTPVFVGTRVPVQALFEYLEGGETLDEFLRQFPSVTRDQAVAALEQAKESMLSRARPA